MTVTILTGDCRSVLATLPDESVHCCVTSPPYYNLRNYGCDGQIGLESSVGDYVAELVSVFREVRRVLRANGTLWLVLGDCFRNKQLQGIPWRVALALQTDGWWIRQEIIYSKLNPLPENVVDRPTRAHETVFLLSKSANYYYDAEAVKEEATAKPQNRFTMADDMPKGKLIGREWSGYAPGGGTFTHRNMRSVWTIPTQPFPGAHFAVMPSALAERCIRAGTSEKGCCLFCGAPWARVVKRNEIAGDYPDYARKELPAHSPPSARKIRPGGGSSIAKYETISTGWRPSCSCDAGEPVPVVCLDPFFGAGTVGLVAQRLGRDALGIELNPNYVALARARIDAEVPPLLAGVAS